jgi:hypothetical protein
VPVFEVLSLVAVAVSALSIHAVNRSEENKKGLIVLLNEIIVTIDLVYGVKMVFNQHSQQPEFLK